MKVIHFTSGNITGGAARGAYFLHQALREEGIDSNFVLSEKAYIKGFEDIIYLDNSVAKRLEKYKSRNFEQYLLSQYPERRRAIFSLGSGIYNVSESTKHFA